jgi:hypothetical protein
MDMNMGRTANLWFRAGVALGLLAICVVGSSGQDQKAAEEKKAAERKAAQLKNKNAGQKGDPKPAPPVRVNVGAFDAQRGLANDAQVQAWEQAYGQQFRQILRTELHFMRLVTQPTKQEYEKIAADTEPSIKEAIRTLLIAANTGNVGAQADARAPIATLVARSVQATLSREQAARYDKEVELRTAARKRAAVLNLVAMMDKVLGLNAQQRDEITKILTNNWTESWGQTQMLMMAGTYLPTLPDAKILPLLSDAQRDIWRGVPKTNARFGFNMSTIPLVPIDDEVWDDEPGQKKREPAGGKAAPKAPKPAKADRRS